MKQDQRHWIDLPQRLREAFGGQVLCLDLPGVGSQVGVASPNTVADMVTHMRAQFVAQVEPGDAPWGVMGFSLGGMVAMHWAASFEQDFDRVVLGNTSASNVAPPHWRLKPRNWAPMLRAATMRDAEQRERRVLDLITAMASPAFKDEVAITYAGLAEQAACTRRTLVRQIRAGNSFQAPQRLAQPALVLVGQRDTLVDPRCSEALARRLSADVRRHPHAGHDLSLDAPGWVVERVAAWLPDQTFQSTAPSGRK